MYNFSYMIQWLLVGSCFFFCFGCRNNIEKEIYYIPNGFIGGCYIIYSQENGIATEYEGNTRIYRFPLNGILSTRFPTNAGLIKDEFTRLYFYVNNFGEIIDTIPGLYFEVPDEVKEMNYVGVINFGYTGITLDDKKVQYSFIMVDTLNTISQKYQSKVKDQYGIILSELQK